MDKPTTLRLPKEMLKEINEISRKEYLDASSTIRKLLAGAIAEWKVEYAVEQYKKGEFSFGQVASFAEISIWEVPALLRENNVPFNYDIEELEAEKEAIKWLRKKQ